MTPPASQEQGKLRRAEGAETATGRASASSPDSDRHGYADETPQAARLSVSEIERGRA
ncbi:hypothetical protein [Novosphingobium sp. PhB55]|uniref:hypothetical protein n=1 Tax=Novosphingobium sp. PhB55 TaxID=2485106 RepID=UPI00141705FC|nr:hypothetical protein [Novosphingobium sp. PhB55]